MAKNDKKKGSPSMQEYMMKRAAMGSVNAPKPKTEPKNNETEETNYRSRNQKTGYETDQQG